MHILNLERRVRGMLPPEPQYSLDIKGAPAEPQGALLRFTAPIKALNLSITYCLEASPDGGIITVGAYASELPAPLAGLYGEVPPGQYARILIANEGGTLSQKEFTERFLERTQKPTLDSAWPSPHITLRSRNGWQAIDFYCPKI